MPYSAVQIENEFLSRPHVRVIHRTTYSKICGPSGDPNRPSTWYIAIEDFNGTVAFASPIQAAMNAQVRPNLHIRQHPLGYSHRGKFGRFDHALSPSDIDKRYPSLKDFVDAVIAAFKATNTPW